MTALLTAERFRPQTQANSPVVPETPRFADSLTLAATHAAIGCAQMFVSHTLYHWNAPFIEDDALRAVTELVTNAVRATGCDGRASALVGAGPSQSHQGAAARHGCQHCYRGVG